MTQEPGTIKLILAERDRETNVFCSEERSASQHLNILEGFPVKDLALECTLPLTADAPPKGCTYRQGIEKIT